MGRELYNKYYMSRISFSYNFKVWVTSAFLSPFLAILINTVLPTSLIGLLANGKFYYILMSIFVGLMLSIPSLIVFSFLTWLMERTGLENWEKKIVLSLLAIILASLNIYLIFGNGRASSDDSLVTPIISYSVISCIAAFFYKLNSERLTQV
jgi:chromate transport protein ChrA